jgi:hypothetical protein
MRPRRGGALSVPPTCMKERALISFPESPDWRRAHSAVLRELALIEQRGSSYFGVVARRSEGIAP